MNTMSPVYAPNPRNPCYGCGKPGHGMRACPDINVLINKEVIHQDDTDQLCWGKEDTSGMNIRQTYRLLWKDNIVKQAKNQKIMTEARKNVDFV